MKLNELALNKRLIVNWLGINELTRKSNGQKFKKGSMLINDVFVDVPTFQLELVENVLKLPGIYDDIKAGKISIKVFESERKEDAMKYRYIRFYYIDESKKCYMFNDKTNVFGEVKKKDDKQLKLDLSKKDDLPF